MATSSANSSTKGAAFSFSGRYVSFSFSREDTNIVSSLCETLEKYKIDKFSDQEKNETLLTIVVLSRNYASNSECLEELVSVVKSEQQVLPIFYHVRPADVQYQTGEFGEALRTHTEMKDSWKTALTKIGTRDGCHVLTSSEIGYLDAYLQYQVVKMVERVVNNHGWPKVSINHHHMEVQVDSGKRDFDQFDIKELFGLMENILQKKSKSESVAVRTLKVLHIRDYELSDIPDNLSFPDLEELVLHPNPDLTDIPSSFFERMLSLKVLEMSNTSISTLPSSLFKLIKLNKLSLGGCVNLVELPESICMLRYLEELNLDSCINLKQLPESFDYPQSLSNLNLRNCRSLVKLPQGITSLKKLQHLYIDGCTNLIEIPESIEFLEGHDTLDLSDCRSLTKLPKSISKLRSLKTLKLCGCTNMVKLSVDLPQNLMRLDLTNCTSLTKLPESMSKLRSLEHMYLSGCKKLLELPTHLPPYLSTLELKYCTSLKKLPESIKEMKLICDINLSGCSNLTEIPESIEFCHGLRTVNLENCKSLTELPKGITKMGSLNTLYLFGCSSLFKTPIELNDLVSPRKLDAAKVSVKRLSTHHGEHDTTNVELYFHNGDTIFLTTELIDVMKNVMEYKFHKTKYVAVWNLKVIHIENFIPSKIPDNLTFPDLEKLFFHSNLDLTYIPSSLFEQMPAVKVLDMSRTSIKTLPPSASKLMYMEKISFRGCELLRELPQEICALVNLKELEFEGIDLVCLPKEIRKLIQLKCLKVSLYDAKSYRDSKGIVAIIPENALSNLRELEEVSIKIVPRDIWCADAVKTVIKDLPSLKKVKTLELYLPTTELFEDLIEVKWNDNGSSIYQALSNFNFIIGPDGQRFISRLPCDLDEEFMKLKKCLKYVNGVGSTDKFGKALEHANALYIDRHWTIQKLSVFRLEGLKKLVFCLLVDCNEMHTVFDGSDLNLGVANNEDSDNLSLQYLAIHYLKNLQVIWKGPGVGCCLRSLKVLTLHMCPNLSTIFTKAWLGYLVNLKEIIVEDCPKIETLIAEDESEFTFKEILPGLKTLSLFYLPELESISSTSLSIAPNLESLLIIDCPKLKMLPSMGELNGSKINTKGEEKWWGDLKWNELERKDRHKFSKLDVGDDPYQVSLDELTPGYGNSLRLLVKEYNDILRWNAYDQTLQYEESEEEVDQPYEESEEEVDQPYEESEEEEEVDQPYSIL